MDPTACDRWLVLRNTTSGYSGQTAPSIQEEGAAGLAEPSVGAVELGTDLSHAVVAAGS